MKLVAGLGNPGARYDRTRHNLGFRLIDRLVRREGLAFGGCPFPADVAQGRFGEEKTVLVKPRTFMNLSGEAVGPLARWYKLDPASVLVVHDDLDLAPGRIRVRSAGGDGGHKGLASVLTHLGTDRVPRLRIGIGRSDLPPEAWVLKTMTDEDEDAFEPALSSAAEAVDTWVREGIEACMNRFNAAAE